MADSTPKLGHLPEENDPAHRDAVHVAVVGVRALERLEPGQRVRIVAGGGAIGTVHGQEPSGIVDPYLDGPVPEGRRFWLCLFPGSVVSLRHAWTHKHFVARMEDRE